MSRLALPWSASNTPRHIRCTRAPSATAVLLPTMRMKNSFLIRRFAEGNPSPRTTKKIILYYLTGRRLLLLLIASKYVVIILQYANVLYSWSLDRFWAFARTCGPVWGEVGRAPAIEVGGSGAAWRVLAD